MKQSYGQRGLENLKHFIRNLCCWSPHNDTWQMASKRGQDKNCSWSRNPLFKEHCRKPLPGGYGKESFPCLPSSNHIQSVTLSQEVIPKCTFCPIHALGAFWIRFLSAFLPSIQPTPRRILWCKSDHFTPLINTSQQFPPPKKHTQRRIKFKFLTIIHKAFPYLTSFSPCPVSFPQHVLIFQIHKATCAFSNGCFSNLSFCMRCSLPIKCPHSPPLLH